MHTRKIQPSDAPAVTALSHQLGYKITVAQTEIQINAVINSSNDIALAAIENDTVIGWIHAFYNIRIESRSFCEIGGLVIDERYRGKGVGKLLIEEVKKWCAGKNCSSLRVRSNVTRAEAHQFYLHLGFTKTKEQKVFELAL